MKNTKEYSDAYYAKNKKKILAKKKQKYYENREENLAKQRERRKANPERTAGYAKKSYANQEKSASAFLGTVFQATRDGAKNRNIQFKISKKYLKQALIYTNGFCTVSGVPLTPSRNHPYRASVDRIDSSKGYIPGNIQIVAKMVNYAKNKFDDMRWFDQMCESRVKLLRKTK